MYVTFLSRFKEVNTRYLAPNSSLLKGKQYIQKTINLKSLFQYSHRILLFNLRNSKRSTKSPRGATEDTSCSSFSLGITATRFWVTVLLSVPSLFRRCRSTGRKQQDVHVSVRIYYRQLNKAPPATFKAMQLTKILFLSIYFNY